MRLPRSLLLSAVVLGVLCPTAVAQVDEQTEDYEEQDRRYYERYLQQQEEESTEPESVDVEAFLAQADELIRDQNYWSHNSDHYRALEWGLVSVRTLPLLAGDPRTWEPASLIGDCGAGLGPVILAWAATALDEDPAGLPEILAWGASEGRERAAALLMPELEKD